MAGKVIPVASIGVGVAFLWSALNNKTILQTFQDVISGKQPQPGPENTQSGAGGTGGSPNPGKGPAYTGGQESWAKSLAGAIGAPGNAATVQSFIAWNGHEAPWNNQPPDGALYTNNPLNITKAPHQVGIVPGTPGVSIISSFDNGISDTAARIMGGLYNDVWAALKSGNGLCGQSFAGLSRWSGGGYSSVC